MYVCLLTFELFLFLLTVSFMSFSSASCMVCFQVFLPLVTSRSYSCTHYRNRHCPQVRHGGCLGLGLAAMGTARQDCYDQLKFCLYQDDAVTGEAAGLAMGLVMLGTKSAQAIEDMVAYAQDTQHEKILRGLALGIALTMYGRLEEADALIESLSKDKDPILRRSGMYTIALAYAG